MSTLINDIKFGIRMLLKKPGLSALTVMVLAAGIGLVTLQLSMVNTFMWEKLPYPDSERLCKINWLRRNNQGFESLTLAEFERIKQHTTSLESLGAYKDSSVVVEHQNVLRNYHAAYITANFLDVINVSPVLGRGFVERDEQSASNNVALISFETWKRYYNKERSVLDQSIQIGDQQYAVIGILPEGFGFPFNHDLWLPLDVEEAVKKGLNLRLDGFGKVKPGVSIAQTQAELNVLYQRFKAEGKRHNNINNLILNSSAYTDFLDPQSKTIFFIMLVMALMVLGIACFNVSNLLLARALLRVRELAVRSALGASRARIIQQLLMESLMLALVGAAGGVLLASCGNSYIQTVFVSFQNKVPYWIDMSVNPGCLGIVLLITVGVGVIAGLLPALRASRPNISNVLKDDNQSSGNIKMGWFAKGAVITQVIAAFVLVSFTLMSARMVTALNEKHYAAQPDKVIRTVVVPDREQHNTDQARWNVFRNIERDVAGKPGIAATGFTSRPIRGWQNVNIITEDISSDDKPHVFLEHVTPGYFNVLEAKVLQGRLLDQGDVLQSSPVVVVNHAFVEKLWPGEKSPVGKYISYAGSDTARMRIVGVVENLQMDSPLNNRTKLAGIYIPFYQKTNLPGATFIFRSNQENAHAFNLEIARIIRHYIPAMQLGPFVSMEDWIKEEQGPKRLILKLFFLFGVVALILAVTGVVGVTTFSVNRRTREFAIRVALGAQPGNIIQQIVHREVLYVAIGFIIGAGLSWAVLRAFENMTREPCQPVSNAVVAGLSIFLCVCLATMPVIRRVTRLDPMEALRYE